jgi:hypothetical protein
MKNSKLIYLLPAMMLLVWGCREEEPAPIAPTCVYIDDAEALNLYRDARTSTTDVAVYNIWSNYTDSNISPGMPLLYSTSINNSTAFNLVFSLDKQIVTANKAKQKVITYKGQRVLVLAIEVADSDTSGLQFFKLSGVQGNGVDAVMAVIEFSDEDTTEQINYTVLQFNACSSPAAEFTTLARTITLNESEHVHNLSEKDAPYIYPTRYNNDPDLSSIAYTELLIPTSTSYKVRTVVFRYTNITDGIKLVMEVLLEDNTDNNERLYSYSDNLKTALKLTKNIVELEVIVIAPDENGTRKGSKVIKQATDSKGDKFLNDSPDITR